MYLLAYAPFRDGELEENRRLRVRASFEYFISNDRPAVAEALFSLPGKRVLQWINPDYAPRNGLLLDYDIDPLDFSLPGRIYREILRCAADSSAAGTDSSIPGRSGRSSDTYAVVIASEHYVSGDSVPFALNDGRIFYEYCLRRLGIPRDNIRLVLDATSDDLNAVETWLAKESRVFNADTRVVVYYSGRCVMDDVLREPCLLPVDGTSGGTQSGLSLNRLYSLLQESSADNALFLIDASYGRTGRDGMRSEVFDWHGPDAGSLQPADRMVVFYAAGDGEGAYPYPLKRHGLFTYFLLKALQDNPGSISYGALFDYISENVQRLSEKLYGRRQKPEVYSSRWDGEAWREFVM